jgi:ribosome maturation factor RimP
MDSSALVSELSLLLKDYLESLNFVFVDIVCRHEGSSLFLKILVDRPQVHGLASSGQSHKPEGGINLDECARLNRDIGGMPDEKDIIKERYILEVSSPGLDRVLKTRDDFSRLLNKKAKFFLNEAIDGKLEWDGLINKISQESVSLITGTGMIEVPFLRINKAKLII